MKNPQPPSRSSNLDCKSQPLNMLLDGDNSSAEYMAAANHVENCDDCQKRLEDMAADQGQWELVGTMLRTAAGDELRDTQDLQAPKNSHELSDRRLLEHLRGVLAAAVHPEMLGRLGRYDIESVIGRGGMGIVLRGFDTELHRPVAIKILASHLAHSGPARQRFARESRAAAAVVHEHVVAIHDVQTDGETPFLVMQYVAGESLQTRVERQGPLSPKEILRISMQAAAGLHAAHVQGVVHRDIKPANILLEPGVERALVTDFGLARTVDEASLTQTGIVAGSPHYMSPEQAHGRSTDARTDIFSLGAVMYFMATGHPPFRAERAMGVLNRICHEPHRPVWESNPELPDELSGIIDQCLQKKESRRFSSAAELQDVLSRALARLQQHRIRPTATFLRRFRRNGKAFKVAIATGLIAACLLAGYTLVALNRNATGRETSGMTRSGDPAVGSTNLARTYSVEVWTQANGDEQAVWNRQLQELWYTLPQHSARYEETVVMSDVEWNRKLFEVQQMLEQLKRD